MKLTDDWKALILDSEISDDNIIILSVRDKLGEFYETKKLKYIIDIDLHYKGDVKGFPDKKTSDIIEKISDPIRSIMEKDKLAICIIESIGDNVKSWTFACRHLETFQTRLNECLANTDYIPLDIKAYEDWSWGQYNELLEMAIEQDNE